MAKIPFSIDYRPKIESGEYKVIDRFGYVLTLKDIINDAWYFSLRYPNADYETERIYDHPENHLFIVTPEPELTEFEKAVKDLSWKVGMGEVIYKDDIVKKTAAELLELAREQFIKDGYVIEKKAFHDAVEKIDDKHKAEMSVEYSLHCKVENGTRHAVMNWNEFQKVAQYFINCGKAEALKDLPRWKKIGRGNNYSSEVKFAINGRYLEMNDTLNDVYEMKLLDLEKLPNFKED